MYVLTTYRYFLDPGHIVRDIVADIKDVSRQEEGSASELR